MSSGNILDSAKHGQSFRDYQRRSLWCRGVSAVMNVHAVLSLAFTFFIVLSASLTDQSDARLKRKAETPWARRKNAEPIVHSRYSGEVHIDVRRGPPSSPRPPSLSSATSSAPGGDLPPGVNKPEMIQENIFPDYTDEKPEGKSSTESGRKPLTKPSEESKPVSEEDEYTTLRPPEKISCRKDEFRCGNGECLPETVKCDNKSDCRDSSDEEDCVIEPENDEGCILPEQPEGGSYELGGCAKPCPRRPGDKVPRYSILTYTCRHNYILNGNAVPACVNDEWYNLPSCHRTCSPLTSTTVNILCLYQGNEVSCIDEIKPGTVAILSCKSSYKLPVTNDPAYRNVTCLEDGSWDRRLFRCLPECGTMISHGNTLVVNGFEAKLGVFPWHVGIYFRGAENVYEQICAGTLLSNNLVVSAAHCFYDEVYGKVNDKSKYALASGKHYRDWDASETYVQKSMVAEILVPERYIGARANFAADIALVKLISPMELTALVRPICMDWDNQYELRQLQVGRTGKSVGWGKTASGVPSETLQEVNMPFVPYDQCASAVPADFRGYITSDKFCAGRLNGSSLCEGDSGGGLCFEMDGVWYLRGVVSVSPVKDNYCDYHSYTVFTAISYYRDWIRDIYIVS